MMKYTILALALVACVASAQDEFPDEEISQASLMTTDDGEVAGLKGDFTVFGDFCISSRDKVFNDIKKNADQMSSKVYALFFDSAESMGRDALAVSKASALRLGAQLANPNAAIADATNDAEQTIAEGQQNIQRVQMQPLALVEAFKASIRAVSQNVATSFSQKIESLKAMADLSTLASSLTTACASIEGYQQQNLVDFEAAKAELASGSDSRLATVTLDQVPCATSRRVTRLDAICKLVVVAKNPLLQIAATFRVAQ